MKNQHASFLRGPVSTRDWLILSCVFSLVLLAVRIGVTGTFMYTFLVWNLFLAVVPYVITSGMSRYPRWIGNRFGFYLLFAIWLLFIPNSFYILTDLFHLAHVDSAPRWFDLLLIFSFAWNGLLFGVLSIRRIELFFSVETGPVISTLVILGVMWLSAFGIYIGRFLRYNSWDVITEPFTLVADIGDMIIHPLENGYAWGMTGVYGLFMTILYFSFKKIGEVIAIRR